MTYSIVARDPATGELGVAVQSRWFNVGYAVPWVEAGVGAVATQSFIEVAHGPDGLALLRAGMTAAEALAQLVDGDEGEAVRQVGIVDAAGRSAAHSGLGCVRFASHLVAPGVTVHANMMERASVPAAMLAAYRGTDGDLAAGLMAALRAAEREGGDVRGRQSAAIVVAPGRAEAPGWERRFDLHVEDHADPLGELARVLAVARAYEAFEATERAWDAGDWEGALPLFDAARGWAPDDDQIALWHAVGLVLAGRSAAGREAFAFARSADPRAGEHLRRFLEAGLLPGGADVLHALTDGT
jgi:uncharacterized Ntn-hydrolase superfamily protein